MTMTDNPFLWLALVWLIIQFLPCWIFAFEGRGGAAMKVLTFLMCVSSAIIFIVAIVVHHVVFGFAGLALWAFAFVPAASARERSQR